MKVKSLVKYLFANDPEAEVVLIDNKGEYKRFSGINTDDKGDVELYIVADDKQH